MRNSTLIGAVIWIGLVTFALGFALGLALPDMRTEAATLRAMPPAELQGEIDDFRLCMQTAGSTGCRMQVPQFARYRALKDELESREVIEQ